MWDHEYALNIACFEIVLWDIHLILALEELLLDAYVVLLLLDRFHHVDEVSEEGLGAIKSEWFFCLSFLVFCCLLLWFFTFFSINFLLFFLFPVIVSFVFFIFLFLDILLVGHRHALEISNGEYNENVSFHKLFDFFDERGDDLCVAVELIDATEVF